MVYNLLEDYWILDYIRFYVLFDDLYSNNVMIVFFLNIF